MFVIIKIYGIVRIVKIRNGFQPQELNLTNDISTLVNGDVYQLAHLDDVKLLISPDENICDNELIFMVPSAPQNRHHRDQGKIY